MKGRRDWNKTEHDKDNNSAAPDKAKSGKQKAEIGERARER